MDPEKLESITQNANSITIHHTDMENYPIWRTTTGEEIGGIRHEWNPATISKLTVDNSSVKILELEKQIKELLDLKIDSLPMITSGVFSLNSNSPVSPVTLRKIHDTLKEVYDKEDITLINASGNLEDLDGSRIRELIKLLQDIEFKNTKEHLDEVVKLSSCYLEGFCRIIKTILDVYETPYLKTEVIVKQIPQVSYEDQEIVIKFKRN